MAMQMMDTAYRPDGPLGALFSGMNSASAEEDQKQNLIREFLANQRETQAQPFDQMGKEYEGRLAQAKTNSPTYIPNALMGYEGQMKSQDAAGRAKQATYGGDVAVAQQNNRNQLAQGSMEEKLYALREQLGKGGSGFAMSPQQQPVAGNGFFGRPQDIESNITSLPKNPDKAGALAQFRQQQQASIDPAQAAYDQQMARVVDTPAHRRALELQQNKLATQQAMRDSQNEAMIQIAMLRGQGNEKAAKTAQEALIRSIKSRTDLTDAEKEIEYAKVAASLSRANQIGGLQIGVDQSGNTAMGNKPTVPAYVPAPTRGATGSFAPNVKSDEENQKAWANLKTGESMEINGKLYTKK